MTILRKKIESKILTTLNISIVLHILIPFFSKGFLHPDEQYYALDFAFDKLGMIPHYEKTWEYNSQIRPWSLPALFYALALPLSFFGLKNPFIYATYFRIISSLFSLFAHYTFIKAIKKRYSNISFFHLDWMLLLSWPILLFHTRTNSENWSSSLFLLALSALISKNSPLFIGALLSLCFFIRFQMAFLFLPLLFILKENYKKMLFVAMSFFTTSIFMILIDYWGYGKLHITPFNYLMVNIFEGKVNTFGRSSLFFYTYKTITKLLPLWGISIFYAFLMSFKKFNKHHLFRDVIVLTSLFLLIHHLIGHKELRFIYAAFPLLLVPLSRLMEDWRKTHVKIFKICNILAFPILFMPLYKPYAIYEYLYDEQENIKSLHYMTKNNPLELKAMLPPQTKILPYKNSPSEQYVLVQNYTQLTKIKAEKNCSTLKSTYPYFLIEKNPFNILGRSNIWCILKCWQKNDS